MLNVKVPEALGALMLSKSEVLRDRVSAGKKLARKLKKYQNSSAVILALPRGGVIVARETAKKLHLPLFAIISKKITHDSNPEYAIGAVSENGIKIYDKPTIADLEIKKRELKDITARAEAEVKRRITKYRTDEPLPDFVHKTVILIDDGLATGMTAMAAIAVIKAQNPKKIVFAAPVCSLTAASLLASLIDKVVCLKTPRDLTAIGEYYQHFEPVSDKEVARALESSKIHTQYSKSD